MYDNLTAYPSLAGRRICFFTSVEGFGGSEVVMADVIEGVFQAGAEVIFWTPPDAPIRSVLQDRSVTPIYRDWPAGGRNLSPAVENPRPNPVPRKARVRHRL